MALREGARVELHYVTAPIELLVERVQRRSMEAPPITREQMEGWAELFQVPDGEEMQLFDDAVTLVG